MTRRFHHVFDGGHVRPQVEVLEHHRELRAHALQLLAVGHFVDCPRDRPSISTVSPSTTICPAFGRSRKLMQRRNVLLPEPLAPMMLMTSPARADSDTPLSTSLSP